MEFQTAAAILPVRDVTAAAARYTQLGFHARLYEEVLEDGRPFYGFLRRDDIRLHLALASDLNPKRNTSAVYLYIDDPDALYAEWSAMGIDGQLDKPEDRVWGVREMSYVDPDGNLLRIGRILK
jgi:catechol 2,3-dioxygenase-like lactoylglutathione lyase family enzyme